MTRLIESVARGVGAFACRIVLLSFVWFQSAGAKESEAPGADIFEGTNIVQIEINIPQQGINTLERYFWGNGGEHKPEAKATITEGGKIYKNVAVHLKGAAGSFRQIDDHPALTLNFDKFADGQRFHGLQKISLNNSVQDPTFIEEKLCREMYEAAGVPVPRAGYAVVTLNGRRLGLYVLIEGYNKQFLRRYFKNVSGNLYDGGFCREITDDLNVNSGDKPNDKSDLQRLADAAERAREKNSLVELSKVLDIDRFITMMALEVIQCHWDGYTMNRNNYRVYHDMDTDRMVFMPHGMDQMFGTGDRGSPHSGIIPPTAGIVASAVMGTTEGRARYLKRLAEVRKDIFKVEELVRKAEELDARIQPYVRSNPFNGRRGSVTWLCRNMETRAQVIDKQLGNLPPPAQFQDGVFRPAEWGQQGEGGFDIGSSKDGKKLLHIAAGGAMQCSWRTKVQLPKGRYRFEGYGRTRDAAAGPWGGAHLRISGASEHRPVLHGDSDWVMLNYDFEVDDAVREVVLVCELRGQKGEAWFDTSSLKIRRLE